MFGRLIWTPARGIVTRPAPARPAGVKMIQDVRVLPRALAGTPGKQNRDDCCAASAATQADLAVEEFPGKVQMPGMPRRLLDHVQHDPANVWRFESLKPVLTAW